MEHVLEPTAQVIRIESKSSWVPLNLGELWEYRELLYFLVWRDVKVRYKQTAIGAAWAIIQPLTTMVIFTAIFSKVANIPSDSLPYPIFSFTALLPWIYLSQSVTRSSDSLVRSGQMIKKVYFPRLIVPIAAAVAPLVDFAVAFSVLIGMMAWYRIVPTWGCLALPGFMVLALITAIALGLFTSAINVRYRDVGYTIPFLLQIWMYASPVAYPISVVPLKWRFLYSLNPAVSVVEGFRWALLEKGSPDLYVLSLSAAAVLVLLTCGLFYFRRVERLFADIV